MTVSWLQSWRNKYYGAVKRGEFQGADGLSWSTCEQGFVSRGEILMLYGHISSKLLKIYQNINLEKKIRRILVSYLFLPGTIILQILYIY